MVGRKLLYTGGFLLFVLSSALCGLAPSLPVLIAFRVAQGIGAALRSCGISIGVAAASSLLAWRLAVRTGSGHNTLHAEAQQLLAWPRRDCPAREFRCHGGRDLARTSARAAILRRKGCVGLTGNRMASFAPDRKIARVAGTNLNRSES